MTRLHSGVGLGPGLIEPWVTDCGRSSDRPGRALLRLHTLGASQIQIGDLRIGPSSDVLFALLLRLTHAPGMQVPRDELLRAFWPTQPEVRRRASLRQALYKLRRHGLRIGMRGDMARLDSTQVVRTFAIERTAARFDRDIVGGSEPFGPFLPGFSSPSPCFEEWLQSERDTIHAEIRRVLVTQLRMRRERADWSGIAVLSRWLLSFDPLNEDATLALAECAVLSGSKVEGVSILDKYLSELGPDAGDIRLPAVQLRRRFTEPTRRRALSFAPTERHFVGRDRVQADLTLAMRRARWRDGSAVLLHAASGVGKTRLSVELAKVATIEGFRELRCTCCESDANRQLSIFLDLVPELMGMAGAMGTSPESMATLRRLVRDPRSPSDHVGYAHDEFGDDAEDGMRPLPAVPPRAAGTLSTNSAYRGGAEGVLQNADSSAIAEPRVWGYGAAGAATPSDTGITAAFGGLTVPSAGADVPLVIEPDAYAPTSCEPLPMAASLRYAIVDLVAAVGDEKPILLIVDDVHWIDSASWDILADLIERLPSTRVFVLLLSREPHPRPARPERMPLLLSVRALAPLSEDASGELAQLIAEDLAAPLSETLRRWFAETSEGNPLFLRALVNHWIETGDAGGVPPTLTQAIEQRLSKLSPDALRTLQAMALLGAYGSTEIVKRALELPTHQLLDAIEELSAIGAFRTVKSDTFICHELLGRTALNQLNLYAGRTLHSRLGEVLSDEELDHSGALAAKTVGHLMLGDAIAQMVSFAVRRGRDYLSLGFPNAALAVSAAASVATLDKRSRASIRSLEIDALYLVGRHTEVLTIASVQCRDANDPSWDAQHPEQVLAYIESARHSDVVSDYNDICARAVLLAQIEHIDSFVRFRACVAAIRIASHGSPTTMPHQAYHVGVSLCDKIADPLKNRCLLDMYFHTAFGDARIARSSALRLQEVLNGIITPRDRVSLSTDVAYALRATGATTEARAMFEAAFSEASLLGMATSASLSAWYLSLIASDFDADSVLANDWLIRCREVPGSDSEELICHLVQQHTARLKIESGDSLAARAHLDHATKFLSKGSNPKKTAYTSALELRLALLNNDKFAVEATIEDCKQRFLRLQSSLGQDYFASGIIRALTFLKRGSEAKRIFKLYMGKHRRETSKLPAYLVDSIKRVKASTRRPAR